MNESLQADQPAAMLDFNDAVLTPAALERDLGAERADIRQALLAQLDGVLKTLFPAAKTRAGKLLIGDVLGSPGDSLEVVVQGDKAGLWTDRATGDGGDVFDLVGAHYGLDARADFARVLDLARDLLGRAATAPNRKPKNNVAVDELGPATAKWDYFDVAGKLIAVVYRYDPPGGKKQFRPWDVRKRRMAPPEPRPLYNQPGIACAQQVVLVEGEKCADVLIRLGLCATTAMHGANAPVDKTDWSPLAGRDIIVWPDNDAPGQHYAQAAARAVLRAGAKSCSILAAPAGKPEGWDCADAAASEFDVVNFVATGERTVVAAGQPDAEGGNRHADDGLAEEFKKQYGNDWRYCSAWGKWLMWDGVRWSVDDKLYVQWLARNVCRDAALRTDSHSRKVRLGSYATMAAVERFARSDADLAADTAEWDADAWLLNTAGGVVDLRTGQLRSHRREDRMTKLATAFPKGSCPTWNAFLGDVTGGDAELAHYLQRVVGYCLTGSTTEHALFFLYGTGANGKSVFLNVLSDILGDYAANAPMDTFMDARGDRHPTDLAGLRGARLVTSTETEQGRRWNESKVKAITGGDKVSARFMRQDFFDYVPQFKLVIAGNHKPSIRNVDQAMKRRMHLVPFTVTIPPARRDGRLTEKLLRERDGILAWAVQGCLDWQRGGLRPPASVVAATEDYFDGEDSLGQWIEERCVTVQGMRSSVSSLFGDWKEWAEAAGEYVGSVKRFSEMLAQRGLERTRLHGGTRAFEGIAVRQRNQDRHAPYRDD